MPETPRPRLFELGLVAAGLLALVLAGRSSASGPVLVAGGLLLVAAGVLLARQRTSRLAELLIAERERLAAAERQAEQSDRLRRRLVDAAGDALFVHDMSGRVLEVNDAACTALGYTRDELLRMHVGDIEVHQDVGALSELWRELHEHEAITLDGVNRRKDGSTFPVEARLSLLQPEPPHVLALVRDVSVRAQLELQLRQAQKMQAISRLAGGVAHDFNSLLTTIRGYTDMLLQNEAPDTQSYSALIEIMKAAERAGGLTRQLLAFTRQSVFRPELLDPNAIVDGLAPMLQRLVGERITLTCELSARGMIRTDRVQLEQILINVVMNARDAMPDGGALRIETRDETVEDVDHVRQPWMRRGAYTEFVISDNGVGMDEDVLARVFEPFFTTKEKGPATGLGLSTAYGVVKQSDGFLLIDSSPGRGTTLRLMLPRFDGRPAAPAPRPEGGARPDAAGRTVLVAEDEEAVRSLISRVLKRHGYTVLAARDGEDALRLALESTPPPDVLLTDIVMPRLGGPELARRLRTDLPGLRVILMSGYTDDAYVLHGALDDGVTFLGKPFAPDELARAVHGALQT